MARRLGRGMGAWAFSDCHQTGMGTGGAAVKERSRALPSMCIGTLRALCEAFDRESLRVMRNTWGNRPPQRQCRFLQVEARGLVSVVEEATKFDCRQVLQLGPLFSGLLVDPFAWAAITQ